MYCKLVNLKLNAVRTPYQHDVVDAHLAGLIAEKLHCPEASIASDYTIVSKSVDSRRGAPELVYTLALAVPQGMELPAGESGIELLSQEEFAALQVENWNFSEPTGKISLRHPVIVGCGPAGLFAAYYLAKLGCAPILLEQGRNVEQRTADIEQFYADRELNESSNILMGAGGAGTFSDGKLYTRTRDVRSRFVLHALLEAGAPLDTAYLKRPHLGTDNLKTIVENLERMIVEAGGTVRYESGVSAPLIRNGRSAGVILESGETLEAPLVLFAHGLGGRALTRTLSKVLVYEMKGFQLGCRMEHGQDFVDFRQYRTSPRPAALMAAEYNFVAPSRGEIQGCTTFCMCPGGEIVPATAWRGQLSSNGMSYHARDGRFANSAVIAAMRGDEFQNADAAYDFLDDLERRACAAGGGDYTFPAQSVTGFLRGEAQLKSGEYSPRVGVRKANLAQLLPEKIRLALQNGLRHFERLSPGLERGTLIGVESCVSSPVRFVRDAQTLESSLPGCYVAGEGAGYAGGIMSAAIDGLRAAEKMATAEL